MASYRIDLNASGGTLPAPVACTFVQSSAVPGKTLSVNEDGSTLVVLPDGTQRSTSEPAGSPNWDSPWTQADAMGDLLVYRSPSGPSAGIPRAYRMVV